MVRQKETEETERLERQKRRRDWRDRRDGETKAIKRLFKSYGLQINKQFKHEQENANKRIGFFKGLGHYLGFVPTC